MSSRRHLLSIAVLVSLTGCSIRTWNDFESDSAIKTIVSTKPFPDSTFGILLSSYRVSIPGHELSRLIVGTGQIPGPAGSVDGIFGAYSFWEDSHLEAGTKLYADCEGATTSCPDDAGASLSPVADVLGGHACVLAGAPAAPTPQVLLACESSDTTTGPSIQSVTSPAAADARFGTSLAAIDQSASNLGLAFASAPGANEIYVLDSTGAFSAVSFPGFNPSAADGVGTTIATARIAPTDPIVAAKLPASLASSLLVVSSPTENRVYVFFARLTMGSMNRDALLLACIDGPRTTPNAVDGFGSVLVAGDLSGDGMPEIVIGASSNAVDRVDEVRIVSLADVDLGSGTAPGCADPTPTDDPTTRVRSCPADPALHVGCEGFGAALAIGNADGNATNDLLVGAPFATVGDVSHAGAAYLFAGAASLDAFAAVSNEPARLVDSSPTVNDTLGLAVTFAGSQLSSTTPREEAVVSVPGRSRLFAYLCSGLAGDSLADDPSRCVRGD